MIKIQPSGDYVQLIYVDPVQESVQQELKSDSDAIEYSSSSSGRVYLQFGTMTFEDIEPTEFEIDSVAVTDAADFVTKLTALFSGGGSSGNSFLPVSGTGTATGDITGDLNAHSLLLTGGALSFNDNGITFTYSLASGGFDYNGESNPASRVVFTTPRFGIGAADPQYYFDVRGGGSDHYLFIDNTAGEERSELSAISSENAGSTSLLSVRSSSDQGYSFLLSSIDNDAGNTVKIQADATANTMTYTSGSHIFPDVVALDFANDGAAATGGVPVGGLYHTSGTIKIRLS